jgi:hypothetical protein
MKKITLLLLFQWTFFSFSQNGTDWEKITFKDAAFFGAMNKNESVVQKDKTGDLTRILTPFVKKSPDEIFRYLLNCYNKDGIVEASQYILSKIAIPKDFDLYRIKCNSTEVLCYDYFANKDFKVEYNRGVKMIVKVQNEEVGLNNPMANYYQPCGSGGFSLCEDWFLVEYYVDNGEIISITPWSTTCSGCVGGSNPNGGGGGNTTPPDPVGCSNNEGNPVSIDEGVIYSGNEQNRFSSHTWIFYQRPALRIRSYEKGTQQWVYVGNDRHEWHFTVLDHQNESLTGTDPDYEITHTMRSAIGNPQGDPKYATMFLHYTINHVCKKNGIPFSLDLNSDATWRANSSEGPWIYGPFLEN